MRQDAIEGQAFVGNGEKQKVQQQLAELDWVMKMAMDQVERAGIECARSVSIDPRLVLRGGHEAADRRVSGHAVDEQTIDNKEKGGKKKRGGDRVMPFNPNVAVRAALM